MGFNRVCVPYKVVRWCTAGLVQPKHRIQGGRLSVSLLTEYPIPQGWCWSPIDLVCQLHFCVKRAQGAACFMSAVYHPSGRHCHNVACVESRKKVCVRTKELVGLTVRTTREHIRTHVRTYTCVFANEC